MATDTRGKDRVDHGRGAPSLLTPQSRSGRAARQTVAELARERELSPSFFFFGAVPRPLPSLLMRFAVALARRGTCFSFLGERCSARWTFLAGCSRDETRPCQRARTLLEMGGAVVRMLQLTGRSPVVLLGRWRLSPRGFCRPALPRSGSMRSVWRLYRGAATGVVGPPVVANCQVAARPE
ncbi:hypothetical protein NDU88_002398 [Pleurodeles waltl]|uniref:Uncharacterized protein n=1 Tax=Pleurodeles waltl TaxID=8319 RepID=A0AAV7TL02_PLEWA|nr:hypothetical protein NDU88_002398 [Pleurodeles waltl]